MDAETKNPAELMHEELAPKMQHANAYIAFVKTNQGNNFLIQSSNVTRSHLMSAKVILEEALDGDD